LVSSKNLSGFCLSVLMPFDITIGLKVSKPTLVGAVGLLELSQLPLNIVQLFEFVSLPKIRHTVRQLSGVSSGFQVSPLFTSGTPEYTY